MAIKLAIYEACRKCGEIDARIEGEWVRYGIHDCRLAEPLAGPPRPKWAGRAPLSKIYFVPAAGHPAPTDEGRPVPPHGSGPDNQ